MSFRYYIVDSLDGNVYGTNDEEKAKECSCSEESWVIDTKNGTWIVDGEDGEVGELK